MCNDVNPINASCECEDEYCILNQMFFPCEQTCLMFMHACNVSIPAEWQHICTQSYLANSLHIDMGGGQVGLCVFPDPAVGMPLMRSLTHQVSPIG